MKPLLLDTCILIDMLRGNTKALDYLQTLSTKPAISTATTMELYAGVRGKKEAQLLSQLMDNADIIPMDQNVAIVAGQYLKKYLPSHGIDAPDAIIAATATNHQLEIATLNLKHFPMFPHLTRPYV